MTFCQLALIGLLSTRASAIRLLVSSYGSGSIAGAIQTLDNTKDTTKLDVTHMNHDCGLLPSWLDTSSNDSMVICVDESATGGLTLLHIKSDGSLEKLLSTSTLGGPVSGTFFKKEAAVALAHYGPLAGISTFSISTVDGKFIPIQNFTFNNPPGPVPARQDNAHVHQALLDPTGQYLLFADLGADLVHIYCVDPNTGSLAEHAPLRTKPGYGPRHASFWSHDTGAMFLYVIHELRNRIVSYAVAYSEMGGLSFTEVDDVSTYGDGSVPEKAAAAEIFATKDFIVASNRLGAIFNISNPDASNSTAIMSDSIVTFKPTKDGKLEFLDLSPSGGINPRHFSLNQDGSMIAIANQVTKNIVVYSRDLQSGKMGQQIASASNLGFGDLTNVQWLAG